jgi:hypothetical protein
MNDWDKDNLMFIMKSDYKTFNEWMNQANDEDIVYALKLIAEYKKEQDMELKRMEASHYPETKDYTQVKQLLEKFRL